MHSKFRKLLYQIVGPKCEPLGTPEITDEKLEEFWSILTAWYLLVRYD